MSAISVLDIPTLKPAVGFPSHEVSNHQAAPSAQENSKGREKTISCSSCRKRKLKCDRMKPKCGTCVRLRHECEYPERRRNPGFRRRNYKELEARLAQVETQLVAETRSSAANSESPRTRLEADWNMGMNVNSDMGNGTLLGPFEHIQSGIGFPPLAAPAASAENIYNRQLLGLGLQEPLPPQDMMDELYEIYFTGFHPTMPIIHRARFYLSLDRAPNARPPICLLYAMWTLAASLSPKYSAYEEVFYERTRRYLELAEMKGHGESFVTLYHAQTWGLVCNYEARKMYFSRSWMSTGRMVRLAQMLGLWRLDHDESEAKDSLNPPKDWVELEERRRTFWAAFYSDRFASSGSGWPMIIQEHEIFTNLPASEEAFEMGVAETTTSLAQALTPEGAQRLSNYGGVLITAAFFGHFFQHVRGTGSSNHPEDFQNGEFWKRHRKMEEVLNNTFIYLPESLRLPGGSRNMNVIFIHMNIQASIIGLNRTALTTAGRYHVDPMIVRQCRARAFMAAEEIVSILQPTHKEDASRMVPWVGFCLYVAAGIFLEDLKADSPNPHSLSNLDQILNAMRAIAAHHSITKGFLTQCELDIESISKNRFGRELKKESGILAESQGVPITVADMQALLLQPLDKVSQSPSPGDEFSPRVKKAATASLSPPAFTHASEPNVAGPGSNLIAATPEFSSWDSCVEAPNPCFEDGVSYNSKYSSTASPVVDNSGFVGYTHATPNTNDNTETRTTPSHEFSYSQGSPLNFVKSSICIPVQDSIMPDGYHNLHNEWAVPDAYSAINQDGFAVPVNTSWTQPKYPTVGLTRGGEAG